MSVQATPMPREFWFARRPAGRGVRPVHWKGWVAVIGYLAMLLAAVLAMPKPGALDPLSFATPLLAILVVMGIATALFVLLVRRRTAPDE